MRVSYTSSSSSNTYWRYLRIFNECTSFTGVGEINPNWRSSMNVEVFNGGARIKPLLKIFNEFRSLTGVGNLYSLNSLNTLVDPQLNVKSNVWYPQVYSIEGVWATRGVCAYNYTTPHHTTSSRCGWGDHRNHFKKHTATTFRSISGFALSFIFHNNQTPR